MTDFLLVSFATKPNSGSERGVGWAFLEACIELSETLGSTVHVVLDARDKEGVLGGLPNKIPDGLFFHFIGTPKIISKLLGASKSRLSYLFWFPFARLRIRSIAKSNRLSVAHQVTFASFVMPSALPMRLRRSGLVKTVWGPASIATNPVPSWPAKSKESKLKSILMKASSVWSIAQAKTVDLAIANNQHTMKLLDSLKSRLEPNIFLNSDIFLGIDRSLRAENQIIMVGALIERKRPWLAIQALARPELARYKLKIVGDGPLKSDLMSLCAELGVRDRVTFAGLLSHSESLSAIAQSELLLHPSCREGSPWVIGEATSMGVPCVVFENSGADTTLQLSGAIGTIIPSHEDEILGIVTSIQKLAGNLETREINQRWASQRAVVLLKEWWGIPG